MEEPGSAGIQPAGEERWESAKKDGRAINAPFALLLHLIPSVLQVTRFFSEAGIRKSRSLRRLVGAGLLWGTVSILGHRQLKEGSIGTLVEARFRLPGCRVLLIGCTFLCLSRKVGR